MHVSHATQWQHSSWLISIIEFRVTENSKQPTVSTYNMQTNTPQTEGMRAHTQTVWEYIPSNSLHSNDRRYIYLDSISELHGRGPAALACKIKAYKNIFCGIFGQIYKNLHQWKNLAIRYYAPGKYHHHRQWRSSSSRSNTTKVYVKVIWSQLKCQVCAN